MIVIDASVAVKWYFPEKHSNTAIRVLANHSGEIVVPALFAVEVCGVLVRHANSQKSQRQAVLKLLADFGQILAGSDLEVRAISDELLFNAARLAIDLGHPLKDCIYLALAMDLAFMLVTADARFAAKVEQKYQDVRCLDTL